MRLLAERGVTDIVIVGPDGRYEVPPARLVTLSNPSPVRGSMSKFIATRELWSDDSRNIMLWGDVFYTEKAVDTIVSHAGEGPHYFRRPGPSEITGNPRDESFAVSWGPQHNEEMLAVADQVATLERYRLRWSCIRTHYAAWLGLDIADLNDVEAVRSTPHQTHIDDWTDDLDSPADFRAFYGRYMQGRYEVPLILPYRPSGCPHREAARSYVKSYYRQMGLEVHEGRDKHNGPFNRSYALNRGAKAAGDWQVAVFGDTDTFVAPDQLWCAVALAVETGQLHMAFTSRQMMTRSQTERLIRKGELPARGQVAHPTVSCAVVVPRGLWEEVGGFDERFEGWGGEDRSFFHAATTLRGEADRVDGPCWHLWHPKAKNPPEPWHMRNTELAIRYKVAAGVYARTGSIGAVGDGLPRPARPEAMQEILREHGGPLGSPAPRSTYPPSDEPAKEHHAQKPKPRRSRVLA